MWVSADQIARIELLSEQQSADQEGPATGVDTITA